MTSSSHTPAENNYPETNGLILVTIVDLSSANFVWQRFFTTATNRTYVRWGRDDRNEWTSWAYVTTDLPKFYKSYSTLAELKAALANA